MPASGFLKQEARNWPKSFSFSYGENDSKKNWWMVIVKDEQRFNVHSIVGIESLGDLLHRAGSL